MLSKFDTLDNAVFVSVDDDINIYMMYLISVPLIFLSEVLGKISFPSFLFFSSIVCVIIFLS